MKEISKYDFYRSAADLLRASTLYQASHVKLGVHRTLWPLTDRFRSKVSYEKSKDVIT